MDDFLGCQTLLVKERNGSVVELMCAFVIRRSRVLQPTASAELTQLSEVLHGDSDIAPAGNYPGHR